MKIALIAAVIVLGLALAGAIYYCYTLNQDKNSLTSELVSTRNTLASTQAELTTTQKTLTTTQDTLALTQTELSSTKDTLVSTQQELAKTSDTLTSTQSELDAANQKLDTKLAELSSASVKLASAEKSLVNLEDELSEIQERLHNAQETLGGLGITVSFSYECRDVVLEDNPAAVNPTWKELMAFLEQDKTEDHTYILGEYDCSQFSRDVHNKAEAAGIRAAEVQISFEDEKTGHALNAFLTTDFGLVYVDCTQSPDKIVYLKAGKPFRAVRAQWASAKNLRNESWWNSLGSYYYMSSSKGGQRVTESIRIYW